MVFWKQKLKETAGFTLIESLVAITILGLVVVPIGSSLVLSFRLNARSESTMQAQLAVSRAVETIMAEGIDKDSIVEMIDDQNNTIYLYEDARFLDVVIEITDQDSAAFGLKVTALDPNDTTKMLDKIYVETYAREGGD